MEAVRAFLLEFSSITSLLEFLMSERMLSSVVLALHKRMKVIKRDGSTVEFDRKKIVTAIGKANEAVDFEDRITDAQIKSIVDKVMKSLCINLQKARFILPTRLL